MYVWPFDIYSGTVDADIAAKASKRIEELYESTEELSINLTKSKDSDVNVLTAQRFYTGYVETYICRNLNECCIPRRTGEEIKLIPLC